MLRLDRSSSFHAAPSHLRAQSQQLPPNIMPPPRPQDPLGEARHNIRGRMEGVLRGVAGNLKNAEHSTQFFTLAQQLMLKAAPRELYPQLIQRFQQENQGRLQNMRSQAAAVNRPFSAEETRGNLQQAAMALRGTVDQTFAAFERHARSLPPSEQAQMKELLASNRALVSKEIETHLAAMTRDGASLEDIQRAHAGIKQALTAVKATGDRLLAALPPEKQPLAQAEFRLQQDSLNMANYSLLSRGLQPSSPTDLSKLPGMLPPLKGALTHTQALQTLGRLEASIKQQYSMRMQEANSLPAELRDAAVFDAQAQRDRLLVTAYRNVLGRMADPLPPPPPLSNR